MSKPSDGRVLEATQEQFDFYIDMAAVIDVDAHKGCFYDESRKLILKGNGYAYEFFFGKKIRQGFSVFVGLIRPLHNTKRFMLNSVTSFIVGLGGKEALLPCKLSRSPNGWEVRANLDRVEVMRFHFVFKFKSDDDSDSDCSDDEVDATLANNLLKEFEAPSFSDSVMVIFARLSV